MTIKIVVNMIKMCCIHVCGCCWFFSFLLEPGSWDTWLQRSSFWVAWEVVSLPKNSEAPTMTMESLNARVWRAFFSHKELESLAGYLYEILAGNPVTDAPSEVKHWGHSGVCGVVRSSEGTENVEDKKCPKARQRCHWAKDTNPISQSSPSLSCVPGFYTRP